MATDKISTIYAKALLELAQSEGRIEEIEEEIIVLKGVLKADAKVWSFFKSPLFGLSDVKTVLDAAFRQSMSKTVYNFLGVLADRKRFEGFDEIVESYSMLANDVLGRKRVTVHSAVKMDEGQLGLLREELERYLGKKAIIDYHIKPELLGGVVVKSGDLMMDTSIKSSLEGIRQDLLGRKILGEKYYEN